jgi:hypothetical protein
MRKLLIMLLCSVALAQDAVVIELPNPDAAKAKQLYDAKVAADKAWDAFNDRLHDTYKGFIGGITFSKDFRFIVPKEYPSATWNNCSGACFGNCLTTAPVYTAPYGSGVITSP